MPLLKSAIKKVRQDKVRTVRNRRAKDKMKSALRAFTDAVKNKKDEKELTTLLRDAYKQTDMAAKKNLIHQKNAARKKSNLAKMLPKK